MPTPVHAPTALIFAGLLALALTVQGLAFVYWPDASVGVLFIPTYVFALLLIVLGGGVISHVGNVRSSASMGGHSTRLRWVAIILVTVAALVGMLFYGSGDAVTAAWILFGIGAAWVVAVLAAAFGSQVFYKAFVEIEVDAEG